MNYPKVSIIILNWNGKEDTIECLESLRKLDYPNYDVIVVDNGSTDGSCEILKKNYPYVKLIENEKNLGVATGYNFGIYQARGEYILLLNNDTVVDGDLLKELVTVLESNPEIGIVGPTMYYYDDPKRIWVGGGGGIYWNKGKTSLLRTNEIDNGEFDEITEVDYIAGCALLTKRELFEEIGYMDTKYFAYWEETDWCVRACKAGYKVLYVPKAKIWHKISSTSKKISGFAEYHLTRNMFWFMRKHATRRQYLSFLLYFFGFQFWFTSGIYIVYHKDVRAFISFFRGVVDGLRGIHRLIYLTCALPSL